MFTTHKRTVLRTLIIMLLAVLVIASLPSARLEAQRGFADFVNMLFRVSWTRSLIEAGIGSADVPDVAPLYDVPPLDINNGIAETATVVIPDGPYILDIGSPFSVGERGAASVFGRILNLDISELSAVIRTDIDADDDDNDALQLVKEIIDGRGGSKFDYDVQPGIDGVQLIAISPDQYTLAINDHAQIDQLTFQGPGIQTALTQLDKPAYLGDGMPTLSLIDIATETVAISDDHSPLLQHVSGPSFYAESDLSTLWDAALDPTIDTIKAIEQSQTHLALQLADGSAEGYYDLLVFYDSTDTFNFARFGR